MVRSGVHPSDGFPRRWETTLDRREGSMAQSELPPDQISWLAGWIQPNLTLGPEPRACRLRRTGMDANWTRPLGLAATALLLSACGSGASEPQQEQDAGGGAGAPSSVDPAQACPASLPTAAAAVQPAPRAPDLPTPLQAWRCFYGLAEVEEGSRASGWDLEGEPEELAPGDLETFAAALDALEPAPTDQMCTMDLGPRALLVYAHAGEGVVGVQVDGFGCREVRLTSDPASVPAGEGEGDRVVPGVLAGDDVLVDLAGLRTTGG